MSGDIFNGMFDRLSGLSIHSTADFVATVPAGE
ncbi:hypothetical protein EHW99_2750 [Erwinia amylovora]|uniref:Uncharacterized protein n=3 Tax=Erwinia amylovora TaxID=552 RepID=A0A830ZXC4_ERWAM|nr:hypothetical protein EaACW_0839 [Erwinia amylovora ACW56400]QJQ55451.1 hypothetical protein EHX00_2750 [Erwinia amylovora]CBA19781.1 hypothetical protein predicted by Glimmer/Critica [Erwinia amylovora CFBP1430]CBX79682.1 hypothetical protein predicted by Glimmer/Critica [Erwinia amylovora ATCC BAA-2158]CCO77685.1 hypothetical protein BN432_0862 [Erwinia amylovora Ea356]CCO81469.1 hypothetical protein BN433_0872 [Erwinia amylovora Ea266]CCO85271.1 hypothetical protein BN434_0858 [Erwinia a